MPVLHWRKQSKLYLTWEVCLRKSWKKIRVTLHHSYVEEGLKELPWATKRIPLHLTAGSRSMWPKKEKPHIAEKGGKSSVSVQLKVSGKALDWFAWISMWYALVHITCKKASEKLAILKRYLKVT
jgi:hypothetical protein